MKKPYLYILISILIIFNGCSKDKENKQPAIISYKEFVTTWKTVSDNERIIIPINNKYHYDYSIDWGDGTVEHSLNSHGEHRYAKPGIYTVKIWGVFPAIYHHEKVLPRTPHNLLTIESWGDIEWEDMNSAFRSCNSLRIYAKDTPNMKLVSDMDYMFAFAFNFKGDISKWDVSNVTTMFKTFYLAEDFDSDISKWNVSKVNNMVSMFYGAKKFNADISNWNVSNVTNMSSMFQNSESFNKNLSNWNVSKVTSMQNMFWGAKNFNGNISNWNVSNVKDMSYMFCDAELFYSNLTNWDVSSVNKYDKFSSGWGGKDSYRPKFNK